LPEETPQFAFADNKEFNTKLKNSEIPKGSTIVAGNNFGCGSSREQAVSCLKGYDFIIIAKGFARIFLQNAINLGLRVIISLDIEADEGDEIEFLREEVINKTKSKRFKIISLPKARQNII
ncbi:MAG: 3-isopropylmalate dehydratase small subunit, partial [Caldiserica bacterium CG17_big_fil_post_rev_8_21_14_2_50_35_7]